MKAVQRQCLVNAAMTAAAAVFAMGVVAAPVSAQQTATVQVNMGGMQMATGTATLSQDPRVTQDSTSIIAKLKQAGNYNTLVMLLDTTGLATTLQGSAHFTLFAPTDQAFAKIPKAKMDSLMMDSTALKKILLFHVVSSKIAANKIIGLKTAKTLLGPRLNFSMKNGRLQVQDATIIQPDMAASNGVIQGIDTVLMP